MNSLSVIVRLAAIAVLTYIELRLWFGSAMSEAVWTWINQILSSGANPGLASDVEVVLAAAVAIAVAIAVVVVLGKVGRASNNGREH